MLSAEEKREMLEDAHSRERRVHFSHARQSKNVLGDLDDFLRFMKGIQSVFPPAEISRKKTLTKFNKL